MPKESVNSQIFIIKEKIFLAKEERYKAYAELAKLEIHGDIYCATAQSPGASQEMGTQMKAITETFSERIENLTALIEYYQSFL